MNFTGSFVILKKSVNNYNVGLKEVNVHELTYHTSATIPNAFEIRKTRHLLSYHRKFWIFFILKYLVQSHHFSQFHFVYERVSSYFRDRWIKNPIFC